LNLVAHDKLNLVGHDQLELATNENSICGSLK
jgi:hypothetical protein